MTWHYHVHCGRKRQDRASISALRHEGFSALCNTKFSRCLFLHSPASKLTASLPLDSWYCSRNVVPVRFTYLAVFFTFQPVYYSTDPYSHNGATFGIARWQARVPCSLEIMFAGIITFCPFVRYLWGEVLFFLFLIVKIKTSLCLPEVDGATLRTAARVSRCVPFEGHRAAHFIIILSASIRSTVKMHASSECMIISIWL
jgi:uncharacterized RDD family membrane protein YckC